MISRQFFREPFYIGPTAFVSTGNYQYGSGTLVGAYGDLFSEDISNLASPTLKNILLTPDPNGWGPNTGTFIGATPLLSQQLAYLAGSTAVQGFNNWNNGTGKLVVADISNANAMTVVKEVDVPGIVDLYPLLIQGNRAVALGDAGVASIFFNSDPTVALGAGPITVTTFDLTDPRNPAILKSTTTTYVPGIGGGQAQDRHESVPVRRRPRQRESRRAAAGGYHRSVQSGADAFPGVLAHYANGGRRQRAAHYQPSWICCLFHPRSHFGSRHPDWQLQ